MSDMKPERAGLATLRAQLGYAEQTVAEREAVVYNRTDELAKAQAALAIAHRRRDDYRDAINLLERSGYAEGAS